MIEQQTEKTTWISDARSGILQVRRCTSKLNPRLIATAVLAISSSANAVDNFPAARYPFQPSLLTDNNLALCKVVLKEAKQQFFQDGTGEILFSDNANGFEWLEWERPDELQVENANIDRLDLDLDGSGEKQIVLMHSFTHSWRGDNFYAFVFKNAGEFKKSNKSPTDLVNRLLALEYSLPNKAQYDTPIRYYPDALEAKSTSNTGVVNTGSDWQVNKLFRWNKRYYFFDEKNPFPQLTQEQQTVYRLRGDGKVELQCRIQTIPDKKLVSELTSFPGFASFHKVISTIGNGGEDCGTLHAGYTHNYEASAATARISYRPWTVSRAKEGAKDMSGHNYYQYDNRLMEFLEDWSFGDIWSRREYQTFLQHISPAEESMATYLKDKFGLTPAQAKPQARAIVEKVIGNWIQVPNYYDHASDLYSVDYHPLNKALFEHNLTSARELIENFSPREHHNNEDLNSFLIDAVDWPSGVEMLLRAGVDPNKQDGFGKTSLMMAAHMNRPDTVQLLLRHGANPNLKTSAHGESCVGIERGQRTALMYAAENASPKVMAILLDAGADPLAVDSKNNGMSFYLNRNPRLTETEKRMDISTLIQSRKGHPLPSAFDCNKATQKVEKLICKNEVLMMYESEMSDAYARFAKLVGAQVKQDQLHWIKNRKTACEREDDDKEQELGCLQQLVSARERYLHNRLTEYEK